MSDRREWGAQVDKSGRLRCYPDGCGIRMNWENVRVREVLPGDEEINQLFGMPVGEVIDKLKQLAALREKIKLAIDFQKSGMDVLASAEWDDICLMVDGQGSENEVGDE